MSIEALFLYYSVVFKKKPPQLYHSGMLSKKDPQLHCTVIPTLTRLQILLRSPKLDNAMSSQTTPSTAPSKQYLPTWAALEPSFHLNCATTLSCDEQYR